LSHFTQPGKTFADEISDRVKVIACIEKPNILHAEQLNHVFSDEQIRYLEEQLSFEELDTFLLVFGPKNDIPTALETIEERCKLAFVGVPPETRKSFADGTTMFERVLPGPDRMYPDTDSAPIPLSTAYIESLKKDLPEDVFERIHRMKEWGIQEHVFTYILRKNLYPILQDIIQQTSFPKVWLGHFFGQFLKYVEGHYKRGAGFTYDKIKELFLFLDKEHLAHELAYKMLPILYEHPQMDFYSILETIHFKKILADELLEKARFLFQKFVAKKGITVDDKINWTMGQLRTQALGNIKLASLAQFIRNEITTA
jgi:glutamyl-tRNA(Gln) amidotransferase subunit E